MLGRTERKMQNQKQTGIIGRDPHSPRSDDRNMLHIYLCCPAGHTGVASHYVAISIVCWMKDDVNACRLGAYQQVAMNRFRSPPEHDLMQNMCPWKDSTVSSGVAINLSPLGIG